MQGPALAVFVLAVTPGPVWIYLISRTLVQGRRAGYFSIFGVQIGVAVHVIAAALGLSAIALAIPVAYDAIKLAGAAYLLWLGISTLRGGGMSFEAQALPHVPDRVLLRQGWFAGRRTGNHWAYDELHDGVIESIELPLDYVGRGEYDIHVPGQQDWLATMPPWARDRREEIVERLATVFKRSQMLFDADRAADSAQSPTP